MSEARAAAANPKPAQGRLIEVRGLDKTFYDADREIRVLRGLDLTVQAGEEMPVTATVAYQVPERQGDLVLVDERFVAAAHRAGMAVHVWTVNDIESMERLVDLGVDGIISDVPTTLSGVLDGRGVAWQRS